MAMRAVLAALLVAALAASHECAPVKLASPSGKFYLNVTLACPPPPSPCGKAPVNLTVRLCPGEDCTSAFVDASSTSELWDPKHPTYIQVIVSTPSGSGESIFTVKAVPNATDAMCCIASFKDWNDLQDQRVPCADDPWGACCFKPNGAPCAGGPFVLGKRCPGSNCSANDECLSGLCEGLYGRAARCCGSSATWDYWRSTGGSCRTDKDAFCDERGEMAGFESASCRLDALVCDGGVYRNQTYRCELLKGCVRTPERDNTLAPGFSSDACRCMGYSWLSGKCCHSTASFPDGARLCVKGAVHSCNETMGRLAACTQSVADGARTWFCDRNGDLAWHPGNRTLGCDCSGPQECVSGRCQVRCCPEACLSPQAVVRSEGDECKRLSCQFDCKPTTGECGERALPPCTPVETLSGCAAALAAVSSPSCDKSGACATAQRESVECGRDCIQRCTCTGSGWSCEIDGDKPHSCSPGVPKPCVASTDAAVCTREGWKVVTVVQGRFVTLPHTAAPVKLGERVYFPFQVRNPSSTMKFVAVQVFSPSGGVQFDGADFNSIGEYYVADLALVPGGERSLALFITPLKVGFTNVTFRVCDSVERKFGCGPNEDSLDTKSLQLWSYSNVNTMVFSGRSAPALTWAGAAALGLAAAGWLALRRGGTPQPSAARRTPSQAPTGP